MRIQHFLFKILYFSKYTYLFLSDDGLLTFSFSLSISVSALYVRKYFDEETKIAAENVIKNIYAEFVKSLETVSWMDEQTRTEAIKKAKKMAFHIGYPNELTDDKKLEEYYNGLELDAKTYFENNLRTTFRNRIRVIKQLRQPINQTEWISHTIPTVVNAFYHPLENSIRKLYSEQNREIHPHRVHTKREYLYIGFSLCQIYILKKQQTY